MALREFTQRMQRLLRRRWQGRGVSKSGSPDCRLALLGDRWTLLKAAAIISRGILDLELLVA
jgi:hypothetical protein